MAVALQSEFSPAVASIEASPGAVQIPETSLVFGAEFIRSGPDLKLVGADGNELLVVNYFGFETPPSLVAPTGTSIDGNTVSLLAGPIFPGQYAQAGAAPAALAIGKITQSDGAGGTIQHVTGETGQVSVGDPVYQGDVIKAADGAVLSLTFTDGTVLVLKDAGQLVLNEFVYSPGGTSNSALLSVLEGTFSMVAGQVAPTGGMKIQTPIATMGIRGTSPFGFKVSELAKGGFLTTLADPPSLGGNVHPIEIFKNGALAFVLSSSFNKVTVDSSGGVFQTPLSPGELLLLGSESNLLYDIYGQYGPPQAPPGLQKLNGSNSFEDLPLFRDIGGGINDGLPPGLLIENLLLLLDIDEDGGTNFFIPLTFTPEDDGSPSAGAANLPALNELNIIDGFGTTIAGVLPFSFGDAGAGSVHFDLTDGDPVVDTTGNVVSWRGTDLVWSFSIVNGIETWTALAGNEPVITLQLNPTTGIFVLTLLQPLDTLDANGDPIDSLSIAFPFTLTVGTDTFSGEVVSNFDDAVPVAVDDVLQSVLEGDASGIYGNVLDNDDPGKDGATLTHINLNDGNGWQEITSGQETSQGSGVFEFSTAWGTYTFAANGDWTFVPADDLDNNPQAFDASFDYRITDYDKDTSEATQPIAVTDGDAVQVSGAIQLYLDEAALDLLAMGNDLQPGQVTGTLPDSAAETDQQTGLIFSAGADSITIEFADPNGANWSEPVVNGLAPGYSISWSLNQSGQLVGTLMQGAIIIGAVIYLSLSGETSAQAGESATPTLTATITGALPNAAGDGDVTITGIQILASEADGTIIAGFADATIADDVPVVVSVTNAVAVNDDVSASGLLQFDFGADGFGGFDVTNIQDLNNDPNSDLFFSYENGVITAQFGDANGDVFFTVALNSDGTYDFDLVTPRTGTAVPAIDIDGGDFSAGSAVQSIPFLSAGVTFEALAGSSSANGYLVPFNGGFGVADPGNSPGTDTEINLNEGFAIAFDAPIADASVFLDVFLGSSGNGTLTVTWTLYDSDGNSETFTQTYSTPGLTEIELGVSSLDSFERVELIIDGQTGSSTAQFVGLEVDEQTVPPPDVSYTFEVSGIDSDGDSADASLTLTLLGESNGVVEGDPDSAETLVGGPGPDTFVLNSESVADLISDYSFSQGDEVDLTALVDLGGGSISNFVQVIDNGDGAVDDLQIDSTGAGTNFVTVAKLDASLGVSVIVNDNGSQANDVIA